MEFYRLACFCSISIPEFGKEAFICKAVQFELLFDIPSFFGNYVENAIEIQKSNSFKSRRRSREM
jgi:hypothetical protein